LLIEHGPQAFFDYLANAKPRTSALAFASANNESGISTVVFIHPYYHPVEYGRMGPPI
jgi:hypothetical protein